MKKRILIITVISALLCLSMLFASCDNAATSQDTERATEQQTESATETTLTTETETETATEKETRPSDIETDPEDLSVPEKDDIDYKTILDEWSKYITSVGSTAKPTYESYRKLISATSNDKMTQSVSFYGDMAKLTTVYSAEYRDVYNEYGYYVGRELTTPSRVETKFFNLYSGNAETIVYKNETNAVVLPGANRYKYSYETNVLFNTIIEVVEKEAKYSVEHNEITGTDYVYAWEYVLTYTYYDSLGNVLGERSASTRATTIDAGGVTGVKIGNNVYHCRDGKIIMVSDASNTYAVPDFTTEYKDNRYSFDSDSGILQVITIKKDSYDVLVNYTLPSMYTDNVEYSILSNGDVLFRAMNICDSNSTDYDFEYYGYKCDMANILVSITTGEATEIESPFYIDRIICDIEAENYGIALNGDYQYAEIRRISDKKLSEVTEFVILDNTLAEVAQLPAIFKNMASLERGLGNNLILVEVESVYDYSASFAANMSTGEIVRYVNENYTAIDNGFIKNGKVYNNALEEVYDLSDIDTYSSSRGYLVCEDDGYVSIGYITAGGSFVYNQIGDSVTYLGNHLYRETDYSDYYYGESYAQSLYTFNGKALSFGLGSSDFYSVSVVASSEDQVVVRVSYRSYDFGYTYDGYAFVYEYYVIK